MAKQKPAEKKTRTPREPRPKQLTIPAVEVVSNPEIDAAADQFHQLGREKKHISRQLDTITERLCDLMAKEKITLYTTASGLTVTRTRDTKDKVRVTAVVASVETNGDGEA